MPLLASRPKVLVPEKLSPDGLALLRSSLDVHERTGLSPEELLEIIPDYDALLVRSETKVTATVLQAAKNLKVVARAGVGVDNVGMWKDPVMLRGLIDWGRCRGSYQAGNCCCQLAFGQYWCCGRTYDCLDDVHGEKNSRELCESQRRKVGTK
jgi:hypothetical protein